MKEILCEGENINLTQTLRDLVLGQSVSFPIDRMKTAKVTVTLLHNTENSKFKTHVNQVNRTFEVIKIK